MKLHPLPNDCVTDKLNEVTLARQCIAAGKGCVPLNLWLCELWLKRANLVYWSALASHGTGSDVRAMAAALGRLGFKVNTIGLPNPGQRWRRGLFACRRWIQQGRRADLQVYFQYLLPELRPLARKQIWLPNYEWASARDCQRWQGKLDLVLCKTRHTRALLAPYALPLAYTGFVAEDCQASGIAKDWGQWLHVAGNSKHKGTERLIALWREHPEFPHLTILQQGIAAPDLCPAPNLSLCRDYLPADALRTLMNRCGVHLCLSEAEGFGHYILNSMSTAAVVLTVDAGPMNEHVTEGVGFCVPYGSTAPLGIGERYYFDAAALVRCIDQVRSMEPSALVGIGTAARERFLQQNAAFPARLAAALDGMGSPL